MIALAYAGKAGELQEALERLKRVTPPDSMLATDEVGRKRYQHALRQAEITGLIRVTLNGGDAA